MKITEMYFNCVKVQSESIYFHDGIIEVKDCDLSNVMEFLKVNIEASSSFNVGFSYIVNVNDIDTYYESRCVVTELSEPFNSFKLKTSKMMFPLSVRKFSR